MKWRISINIKRECDSHGTTIDAHYVDEATIGRFWTVLAPFIHTIVDIVPNQVIPPPPGTDPNFPHAGDGRTLPEQRAQEEAGS